MNVVINRKEHNRLLEWKTKEVVIGSRMYGTNTDDSDMDLLCFYNPPESWQKYKFPNIHQFQYTENNVDYIWTTGEQFWRNQRSGDSTINTDVIMFDDQIFGPHSIGDEEKLRICRTYKVIKAFLGFAKRDIQRRKERPNKLIHAERSMYCALSLMNRHLPELSFIQDIYKMGASLIPEKMLEFNKTLRSEMNSMYEKGELKMYHVPKTNDPLLNKLLDSNNTKEFRYV